MVLAVILADHLYSANKVASSPLATFLVKAVVANSVTRIPEHQTVEKYLYTNDELLCMYRIQCSLTSSE